MTDTRDVFERHFVLTTRQQTRQKDGTYRDPITQARWDGWQAQQGRIAELETALINIQHVACSGSPELAIASGALAHFA